MENNILQEMATYDFNTPIQVTMICEDNEDENDRIELPHVKKEIEKEINHTASNIKICENNQPRSQIFTNDEIKLASDNQNTNITEEDSLKRLATALVKDIKTYTNQNNTDIWNCNKYSREKINDTITEINKHFCDVNENVYKQTEVSLCNKNTDTLRHVRIPAISPKSRKRKNFNPNTTGRTNDYVSDLINEVSEHLITILKNQYIPNTNVEQPVHHFYRIKYSLFSLSYSTVSAILLPEAKNPIFTKIFLRNTLQIASMKGPHNFTYAQLESLYYEMLHWTKTKKNELLANVQHLGQPSVQSSILHRPEITKFPVFEYKGDTPVLRTQLSQPSKPFTNLNMPIIANSPERTNQERSTLSQKSQGIESDMSRHLPLNKIYEPNKQIPQNDHSYMLNQTITNINQYQLPNMQPTWDLRAINVEIQQEVPSQYLNNKVSGSNLPVSRPPPPYNTFKQCSTTQSIPTFQPQKPVQSEFIQNETQLGAVRSVSTDSGFMSPLHDQSNQFEDPAQILTPQISYVTSLNPKASYIEDGNCHVCKNITRQMCLGCYKVYYCSSQCQSYNWRRLCSTEICHTKIRRITPLQHLTFNQIPEQTSI